MKLEMLVPWWGLIPFVLMLLIGLWQLWRVRRKGKSIVWRWARRAVIALSLLLIALGPSVPGGTSSIGVANLDVIFVVDTTPSMGALDYNGTKQRMVGVRSDLLALTDKLEGARFEIITFDSAANLVLPFTNDLSAVRSAIQGIGPDVTAYSQGTSVYRPISYITEELKYSKQFDSERKRLLFYLSDGEQTATGSSVSFATIQPDINGGAVMGYGTSKGAQVVKYTGPGEIRPASDFVLTLNPSTKKLEPVISKLDATRLKVIAKQLKVSYQDRNKGGAIDAVYKESKAPLSIDDSQHVVHYLNLYWLFAIPLVLLIFWEWQTLIVTLMSLRQKRKGKHRG